MLRWWCSQKHKELSNSLIPQRAFVALPDCGWQKMMGYEGGRILHLSSDLWPVLPSGLARPGGCWPTKKTLLHMVPFASISWWPAFAWTKQKKKRRPPFLPSLEHQCKKGDLVWVLTNLQIIACNFQTNKTIRSVLIGSMFWDSSERGARSLLLSHIWVQVFRC